MDKRLSNELEKLTSKEPIDPFNEINEPFGTLKKLAEQALIS